MTGTAKRIGVFVLVVAAVVGMAAIGGYAMAETPPDRTDATIEKNYFTDESLIADAELTDRSGEVELSEQDSRTILVSTDGQVSELEPVIEALVANGHEVRVHGGGSSIRPMSGIITGSVTATQRVSATDGGLEEELGDVDAVLAIGGTQFSDEEYETIESFAEEGSVVLATDPSGGLSGTVSDGLTARFGISVGEGYLYNMHENDANYQRVYAAGASDGIGENVDRIVLDTAAPVTTHDGNTTVTVGDQTRYSVTRENEQFAAAAQTENVVVIGDSDFMTPLDYNRADNNVFLGNVLEFLTDTPEDPYTPPSDKETSTPDGGQSPPGGGSPPPTTEAAP
ncbi:putative secreted protein [Halanaeroarchaeum sp. HSR-CO]|uniref:hypothetical protein n=1 Tax=Halanaeroarchaeum sp. HSR-CO TaxID=2866382 RepID=UPI00217D50E7|nr:hypothetical protein [Halanaeroarchaeum sp. HSR-CO]UWG47556.1 putative secreted protein [Halanaeroarchaeum sp. HSR-CO]